MKKNPYLKSIFLAEGAKHVREALRLMLDFHENFVIAGEAGTPESLLDQVCRKSPDIILLDWNLPGVHHKRIFSAVKECCPETLIIVTSVRSEVEKFALDLGTDGFLLKQLAPDEFINSLSEVIKNKVSRNF
jgi:DNA-binding NarL/FixJ family response regulator